VAKNVFLWPSRTYIRKGFELYFTVLIEVIWSKKRIMVVYLNVMETGNGIYGVEAAARKYFRKPAAKLTRGEAALIAASLPNPRKRNPAKPSTYLLHRQARILYLMNKIGKVEF
jgi:monofunctional biosynthetic peptidoglycan transglycosylase